MSDILFAWLLAFVNTHSALLPKCPTTGECPPEVRREQEETPVVREAAVRAAATVALDADESPLRGDSAAGDDYRARAETALLLLAIADHETGLQPRLWRGECRPRECDHGAATGELQLHLGTWGSKIVSPTWVKPCTRAEALSDEGLVGGSPGHCWTRENVLADHEAAFRVALHMLRGGGLEGYTGQGPEGPAVLWIRSVVAQFEAANPPPGLPAE